MRSVQALARNSTNVPAIACPRDRYVDELSWKCLVAIAPPSHLSRVLQSIRGRVRQEPHTARRRDAALHGPRDPLAHRDERERSDCNLVEAARCGALVVARHAAFWPPLEKIAATFRGSSHGKLYTVNDNEPGDVNSGVLMRVVPGAIALRQFPCDIKINGVIVLARHVDEARAQPPDDHLFVHNNVHTNSYEAI